MNLQILYVEDDPSAAYVMERTFGLAAPDVLFKTAHKLEDAIDMLAAEKFHAVILDLTLPDSRRCDGLRRIRSLFPDVPVIIFSGSDDDVQEAMNGGAQDFLIKGEVAPKNVLRAVRHAILRKEVERGRSTPPHTISALLALDDLLKKIIADESSSEMQSPMNPIAMQFVQGLLILSDVMRQNSEDVEHLAKRVDQLERRDTHEAVDQTGENLASAP